MEALGDGTAVIAHDRKAIELCDARHAAFVSAVPEDERSSEPLGRLRDGPRKASGAFQRLENVPTGKWIDAVEPLQ